MKPGAETRKECASTSSMIQNGTVPESNQFQALNTTIEKDGCRQDVGVERVNWNKSAHSISVGCQCATHACTLTRQRDSDFEKMIRTNPVYALEHTKQIMHVLERAFDAITFGFICIPHSGS